MSEENKQKAGTMTLFKIETEKKKKPESPDFNGMACIKPEDIDLLKENGGMVRLSGWLKLPKTGGAPYISGYAEAQKEQANAPAPPEKVDEFMTTPAIAKARQPVQDAEVIEGSNDLPF